MKKLCFLLVSLLISTSQNTLVFAESADLVAIQSCLAHWGKTPFSTQSPTFRTLSAKVKVLGVGGETSDELSTTQPDLVLIKPNVSVLSKSTLNLMNPSGWYCLKGQTSVLAKSEIHLHCSAHLASSNDGATVMGANDTQQGGVNVLGTTRVIRTGDCANSARTNPTE